MTTCRKSTINDLLDPQLTAFRARLMDAVQQLFEGSILRRVVISDVIQDPM